MVLARKHRNLTAVQLAQRIHELGGPLYDRATISRIETGHRTVTLAEAWLIAQALALPFVAMCNPEPMLVETRVEIP
jgi:transcriptional regulator with XRE-family HTH domain